jgi:hypothetical protein
MFELALKIYKCITDLQMCTVYNHVTKEDFATGNKLTQEPG